MIFLLFCIGSSKIETVRDILLFSSLFLFEHNCKDDSGNNYNANDCRKHPVYGGSYKNCVRAIRPADYANIHPIMFLSNTCLALQYACMSMPQASRHLSEVLQNFLIAFGCRLADLTLLADAELGELGMRTFNDDLPIP